MDKYGLNDFLYDDMLDWLIKKRDKLREQKQQTQITEPLNITAIASIGGKTRAFSEIINKLESYDLIHRLASGYGISRSEAATLVVEANKELMESLDKCRQPRHDFG